MRVLLISPFGSPAYGVSPYADSLFDALQGRAEENWAINRLDFQSAYPRMLYPTVMPSRTRKDGVHWAKPWTWKTDGTPYNIVHIQYWTRITAPYLARIAAAAKSTGAKVVLTLHNIEPHEGASLMKGIEARLFESADAIITHISPPVASFPAIEKNVIIPHGIRFPKRIRATKNDYRDTGLDHDRRYVLFFGNIRPYKGICNLLRAWESVQHFYKSHDLLIVGRPWQPSGLARRLVTSLLGLNLFESSYHCLKRRLADKRVHFFEGYASEEFVDACCRIAELAVFPYQRFSAQSGAATRVAGFGRRLLVTDVGGLKALVTDHRFVAASPGADALARSLSTLLADSLERIEEGEKAQIALLKKFSWSAIADRHLELYSSLATTK